MQITLPPEIWGLINVAIGALIIAIIGPTTLELMRVHYSEKKRVEHHEKEVRYKHMLIDLIGFYSGKVNREKIEEFCEHYRHAWLYSSDEAIKRINAFLIASGAVQQEIGEKEKSAQKMVLEMRQDFRGKTKLTPEDFLFVTVRD